MVLKVNNTNDALRAYFQPCCMLWHKGELMSNLRNLLPHDTLHDNLARLCYLA